MEKLTTMFRIKCVRSKEMWYIKTSYEILEGKKVVLIHGHQSKKYMG